MFSSLRKRLDHSFKFCCKGRLVRANLHFVPCSRMKTVYQDACLFLFNIINNVICKAAVLRCWRYLRLVVIRCVTNSSVQEAVKEWRQDKTSFSNEPPHDKTNKMICSPSEDSDQPEHAPSLIKVFAVRMKKFWVLIYPLIAQRRLWCPGWSESSLGAHAILFVL